MEWIWFCFSLSQQKVLMETLHLSMLHTAKVDKNSQSVFLKKKARKV